MSKTKWPATRPEMPVEERPKAEDKNKLLNREEETSR